MRVVPLGTGYAIAADRELTDEQVGDRAVSWYQRKYRIYWAGSRWTSLPKTAKTYDTPEAAGRELSMVQHMSHHTRTLPDPCS